MNTHNQKESNVGCTQKLFAEGAASCNNFHTMYIHPLDGELNTIVSGAIIYLNFIASARPGESMDCQ